MVVTFSYNTNLSNMRKNVLDYDNRLAQNLTEKIKYFLSTEEVFFKSYINNQEVVSFISNGCNKENFEEFRNLSSISHKYMNMNPEVYDIILFNNSRENCSFYSSDTILRQIIPIIETKKCITVFSNNNTLFVIPQDVYAFNSPQKIGTCVFLIYGSVFSNVIGEGIQTGYSKFYVISSDMLLLSQPKNSSNEEIAYVASIALNKDSSNQITDFIGGRKYLIRRTILESYGFQLVSTMPLDDLYKNIPSASPTFILMLVFSVLLISSMLAFFFYKIENSFESLLKHMNKIKSGDLEARAQPVFGHEMSEITEGLNDMMNKIVLLTNENSDFQRKVFEGEILNRTSKLKSLQSQMNPHFINNTLTCIKSIALYYSIKEISEMCSAMAKILKYSKSDNLITTVSKELEMITSYLYIQSIRFIDKYEVKINIDEKIKDYKMLRFILQPIVENSITHGLESKPGKGVLSISGYHDGNELVFNINDDGVGIKPDIFRKIKHALDNNTIVNIEDSISSGWGIGLVNIHNRIQLYYGKEYFLSISSIIGTGTYVTIRIPDDIDL